MPVNECIPYYEDGDELTILTTAIVVGKTFLAVSATLDTATGLTKAATCGAGLRALGVAGMDAASGQRLRIWRGTIIVPVTADGSITAGNAVEVGTAGKAKANASGVVVGICLNTVTDGLDAKIALLL